MDTGLIVFILTAVVGLCLLVGGVFILAGAGWACISAAGALLVVAGFIRKGLTSE
jgi:uncharacterized membrane protein YqiK